MSNLSGWGPKTLPQGVRFRYDGMYYRFETPETWWTRLIKKRVVLPAHERYWLSFKAVPTTHAFADQNIGSYGWTPITYAINYVGGKKSEGRRLYYVGGPEYPIFKIQRIGSNYFPEADNVSQGNLYYDKKPITVNAGEPFDVEVKTLGRRKDVKVGLSIKASGARVMGERKVQRKVGESHTWKLMPQDKAVSLSLAIDSECGTIEGATKLEFPVVYDFKKLTKDTASLSFGILPSLVLGNPNSSFDAKLYFSVVDDGRIISGVPDAPITIKAVYKDYPNEVVKHVIFTPYEKNRNTGTPQGGSITLLTGGEGEAKVNVSIPELTKKEAERGIIVLKLSTSRISNLTAIAQLIITGVSVNIPSSAVPVTQPQVLPPQKEDKQQVISPKVQKITPKSIKIIPDRSLVNITEGDVIRFGASLVMSDGSERPATGALEWGLIGDVGSIAPDGTFTAKLANSIAEYGKGQGVVIVLYKDAEGNELYNKTEAFTVKAFVPVLTPEEMRG